MGVRSLWRRLGAGTGVRGKPAVWLMGGRPGTGTGVSGKSRVWVLGPGVVRAMVSVAGGYPGAPATRTVGPLAHSIGAHRFERCALSLYQMWPSSSGSRWPQAPAPVPLLVLRPR